MISPKAKIGKNVKIGTTTIVHDNVSIGDNVVIGEFCIIGLPTAGMYKSRELVISQGSLIRSHTVLYEGSSFGDDLMVGHNSMIREGVVAGKNLQIGSFNDIEGDCKIGDWVRFHSNVHIGRGSNIGSLVWIFPYVVLTNDPLPPSGLKVGVTVGDGAVICTSSVILPGACIGTGAFIAAMTRAKGTIPNGALVVGFDGKIVGAIDKLKHKQTGKRHPWMTHFSNYYPESAHQSIEELHKKIERSILELNEKILHGEIT